MATAVPVEARSHSSDWVPGRQRTKASPGVAAVVVALNTTKVRFRSRTGGMNAQLTVVAPAASVQLPVRTSGTTSSACDTVADSEADAVTVVLTPEVPVNQ